LGDDDVSGDFLTGGGGVVVMKEENKDTLPLVMILENFLGPILCT